MPKVHQEQQAPQQPEKRSVAQPKKETTSIVASEAPDKVVPWVKMEKAITQHFGDNNYVKISVSVDSPINPTEEQLASINSTFQVLSDLIDEEINYQLNENMK